MGMRPLTCPNAHAEVDARKISLRERDSLRTTSSTKRRAIDTAARRGDARCGTATHVVLAEYRSASQIGKIKRGRSVSGPERGTGQGEQCGIGRARNRLTVGKDKAGIRRRRADVGNERPHRDLK